MRADNPHFNGHHVELQLYQHDERELALLLSINGCRREAHWIPKSLLIIPATTFLVRIDGEPSERGIFSVAEWKAKEVGWMAEEDVRQLRLIT